MRSILDLTERLSGLIVAGTRSGSGKTLVALGLAAALGQRGLRVQGFKVGPDFIDPSHLAAVSGRPVHNLDGWMLTQDGVLELFLRHGADADCCLVEGVMGLFDGASGSDEAGSTAQMAKWLHLPVVLVVDARSQGRSAAALIKGFRDFDPELDLAGVVFSQVGSPDHVVMLREAMAAYLPDLPCLGFLPRRPDLALPSRHLGLHMAEELGWTVERKQAMAEWVEQGMDMGLLARSFRTAEKARHSSPGPPSPGQLQNQRAGSRVRLGVARDQAFCFYYPENLRLLEQAGAKIVDFSPISDSSLPDGVQGLFLGGGYPELHADRLSENMGMRRAILKAARSGMPIYAECGGMIYLLRELEAADGKRYSMAGYFTARAKMFSRFQALGYRTVTLQKDCLLGPAGAVLRGHEFHYSALGDLDPVEADSALQIEDRHGRVSLAGFHSGNVLASYIHLHFGSNPQAAASFVQTCASWPTTSN